jgi:hypothetical protein
VSLDKDLREFLALLREREVEFLVVGGHAVAFHGFPRWTGDLDVWVRPDEGNAAKLLAALEEFGFGALPLSSQDFVGLGKVVQLGHPPTRIDLMTSVAGLAFDEAWDRRVEARLGDQPVWLLDLDSLLRNKRAAGRTKDLLDAAELEARREPG